MPHGDYSLVVKLRFVDPVSRVRFSLVAQMKKLPLWSFSLVAPVVKVPSKGILRIQVFSYPLPTSYRPT